MASMEQEPERQQATQAEDHAVAPPENDATADSAPAHRPAADTKRQTHLDFILDIPLEITVELGRTQLVVNELLQLGQGSVIELSKSAGETLEIRANQKLIARGEVVVVNDKYGIRLTEVISPIERVEKLR
jgi:flagellar motor switch protein FliN/FliY